MHSSNKPIHILASWLWRKVGFATGEKFSAWNVKLYDICLGSYPNLSIISVLKNAFEHFDWGNSEKSGIFCAKRIYSNVFEQFVHEGCRLQVSVFFCIASCTAQPNRSIWQMAALNSASFDPLVSGKYHAWEKEFHAANSFILSCSGLLLQLHWASCIKNSNCNPILFRPEIRF